MLIPLYLLALLLLQTSKSSPSESGRGFVGQLIENKHGKVFLLRNAKEYKEDQEKKQEENRREKDEDGGKNDYKGEADDFMVENICPFVHSASRFHRHRIVQRQLKYGSQTPCF